MDFEPHPIEPLRQNQEPLLTKPFSIAMTVNKQFAQDGEPLEGCMESLLEVLAELLDEPQDPAATGTDNQGGAAPVAELRSDAHRVIHVVVSNQEK